MDEAQEAELAASIEGVSALNELGAGTGRRARMKAAAAEDDAAELQVWSTHPFRHPLLPVVFFILFSSVLAKSFFLKLESESYSFA